MSDGSNKKYRERHDTIKDLIRTEKLKLLAEVMERVQVNQNGQFDDIEPRGGY